MMHETRVAYGEALAELVKENENIVVLDADLSGSTKTALAKKACPERHFNMGIAEGNMMTVAAGLAASGKTVFASSFAIFETGRAYEQIRNSIGYTKLNVKVCATHAGISVGEDGASHQSIEDIALMRVIPNMQVFVPSDYYQTKAVINYVSKVNGPCYVRIQRGKSEDVYNENTVFENLLKAEILRQGKKAAIFATGLMVQEALKAADILAQENIDLTVVNVCSIKPLDTETICKVAKEHDALFTVEEHSIIGGLYGAISECLIANEPKKCVAIGVNDRFGESGTASSVLEAYGLCASNIVKVIKENI